MLTPKEYIKKKQNNVLLQDYTLTDVIWFMEHYANYYNDVVNKPDENINLERAKKYARHQHFLGTQQKDLVEFDDWKHVDLLTFEQWYELNESEINMELAENGADRELDFDSEREFEKRYEKYCSLL